MQATLARQMPLNAEPLDTQRLIWMAFTLSVTASLLPLVAADIPTPLSYIVAVAGSAGCGWLWLVARTLFRAEKPIEGWTIYTVAGIVAIEGTSNLMRAYPPTGAFAEFHRILGNAEAFICIGALVMVFAEVFAGYNTMPAKERRFRRGFALTLAATIALTLLWVMNAAENSLGGQLRETVIILSAFVAVVGTRFCISYRKRNPLTAPKKQKNTQRVMGDELLAKRIIETLHEDNKFTTPELKVADLADLLGEQEYKVTQCITGTLGFRNFNHLINSHRIGSAKEALADPANKDRPILSVAFDCGFNSIGPFNRAFKQEVGMTPRQYRTAVEAQGGG